jgi:hypothetical protein
MKTTFLGPVLLLFLTHSLAAQKIESALSVFRKKFPSEKIYIHYNKEYFTAGETIWLKAYLTIDHVPSGISNNFYLQLTDYKGNIISNKKYPVTGATVSGQIDIPDSIASGIYTIMAFTPVMLSPGTDFIYRKSINIYNSFQQKGDNSIVKLNSSKISLRFFPEGGNLVSDINTVIAFKAENEFGYPVDLTGIIQTEDSSVSMPFKTFHDGIGQLHIKPQSGKKYVAIAEINGKKENFFLPPVQRSGLKISIEEKTGNKLFIVSRDKRQQLNFDNFKVVAQINNIVVYERDFYFGNHYAVQGNIVTDSLPSGILHVTVFNNDDAPILERLTFVNNREYESMATLSVLKLGANPREINNLKFDFPDSTQRSCSIAVTDFQDDSVVNKENIISSILLTSDLKGNIFNPLYYFSRQNDSVKLALDNLMLTHGWRRFNWKKILQKEYPEPKKVDEFLINITGTIKNQKKTDIMSGGGLNIFIATEDSSILTYHYPVNEFGQFVLDSLGFAGSVKIYYSYIDKKGNQKPVTVFLNEQNLPVWPAEAETETKMTGFSDLLEVALKKETSDVLQVQLIQKGFENVKELENVTVTAKPKRPLDVLNEKYATGVFRTGSRYIIDNVTKPEVSGGAGPGVVSSSFITNRLPRVGFFKDRFFNLHNSNGTIAVYINESPATIAEVDQLRIDQIAIVKFFDIDPVVVSSDKGGGTIAIYTKKFEENEFAIQPPDAPYITYNGYSIEKEFYSPDYSLPTEKNKKRDLRNTLYWNPKLYTSSNENSIHVNFYNNDISRKFKIVLEGIDLKGRLIFLEQTIGE